MVKLEQVSKVLAQSGVTVELTGQKVEEADRLINPLLIAEQNLLVQACEVLRINNQATAIEQLIKRKGYELPSVYGSFTIGFDLPQDKTEQIGVAGKDEFEGFVQPDIAGHEGKISIVKFDNGQTMMVVGGRPHATSEWASHEYGSIISAHNFRVIQEMGRRREAEGSKPHVFLTFMTGGDFLINNPRIGGLATLVDGVEKTNNAHPGAGPMGLLEEYLGLRFQSKAERTTDRELASSFIKLARKKGFDIRSAVAVGTPGTPEFQGLMEIGDTHAAFEKMQQLDVADKIIGAVGGENWKEEVWVLYCMSILAELAIFRAVQPGEEGMVRLPMGIITDEVATPDMLTTDHLKNSQVAVDNARQYMPVILELAEEVSMVETEPQDFSIRSRLTT